MSPMEPFARQASRRVYFWPSEHGAWIWWIGPFLIGVAAGGRPNLNLFLLFVPALAAFLQRQASAFASSRRASPSSL